MELNWSTSENLSALHAAWCVAHFPECRSRLSADFCAAAEALLAFQQSHVPLAPRFWDQLLSLAATNDVPNELAERLISRLGLGSSSAQGEIMLILRDCKRSFSQHFPSFQRDAGLRAGPLQQQWQAHGPGLLVLIDRHIREPLLVERAAVVLVQPVLGGAGYAHLTTNRVHLESLLTNPDHEITETLRLAWLLSQLDLERPIFSESLNLSRLQQLTGFATLPATLLAGQELGLCEYTSDSLQRAMELWRVAEMHAASPEELAPIVGSWWETYEAAKPPWRIALAGLEQMLFEPRMHSTV